VTIAAAMQPFSRHRDRQADARSLDSRRRHDSELRLRRGTPNGITPSDGGTIAHGCSTAPIAEHHSSSVRLFALPCSALLLP
jgi:hypothetical protein